MQKTELFFRSSKKQWLYLTAGLLLSCVTIIASVGLLSVAGYLICGAAIAGVTGLAASFNYLLPATIVRFFALVRIGGRYGDRVVTHEATFRILKDLRVWFYQMLEPLAPGYLLTRSNADLLNRMVSDIDALDKVYLRLMIPFFSSLLLVILTGIFLYFFNATLSLYVVLLLLVGITLIPVIAFRMGKLPGVLVLQKMSAFRIKYIEYSTHLMDLLLYGKAAEYTSQLIQVNQQLLQQQKKQAFIRGLINALISLLTSASLLIVLLIGIPLLSQHQLTGANLGLLALMIFAVFEAINLLPQACQFIGEIKFASDRVCEIAGIKPLVQFPQTITDIKNYHLKFNKINFQYAKNLPWIIKDFSWDIPFGTHMVLLGSTGIGKSTLAYLAVRCFDPSAGEIYLGGHSMKFYTEMQIRDTLCYISQNSHMFHSSIRENLLLSKPTASDAEIYAALELVNLKHDTLQLPEQLATSMGEFGKQFSGGQIRRFALVRALLKSAPITILDEPLEGVDDATAKLIIENLQRHFFNKTLILITHQRTHIPNDFLCLQL